MTGRGILTIAVDATPARTRERILAARAVLGDALGVIRLAGDDAAVAAARPLLDGDGTSPERGDPPAWRGFLPAGHMPVAFDPGRLGVSRAALMPWPVTTDLPSETCREPTDRLEGWIATAPMDDADAALPLHALSARLAAAGVRPDWLSAELPATPAGGDDRFPDGRLTASSSVAAIVPHLHCEEWLDEALRSLARQTRPLDAVIVVDDGSGKPPQEICAAHPGVSLYATPVRVGPYRIVQSAIESSGFEAYLFQDADDFSAIDRLERLLDGAAASGAELIGTQEIRLITGDGHRPATYPLDVNRASARGPRHPLLHPTSLVARSLVARLGGFPTGLRFSGDTEFLYRAVFTARIVNLPSFGFIHRIRPHSLTTSAETGMQSPAREAVLAAVRERAAANLRRVEAGLAPDLAPIAVADPVPLRHVAGPAVLEGVP